MIKSTTLDTITGSEWTSNFKMPQKYGNASETRKLTAEQIVTGRC